MTKSFDEWLDTTKLRGYMDENSLEAAYEAGQQSKQAEVDELQKRIDEALHEADESCGVSVDAFVKLNRIFKRRLA
jgi:DNA-binding GntR family transcriptional regulator